MKEEKIDHREPVNREPVNKGSSIPAWQLRLLEERDELRRRTIALKNTFSNPEMKLNEQEWRLLHCQFDAMQRYLQILTDRCIYYELIFDPADLGLRSDTPCSSR